MKHINYFLIAYSIITLILFSSCAKLTNRQAQVLRYNGEGELGLMYLKVENNVSHDTMWVSTDTDNMYENFCEKNLQEGIFRKMMSLQVESLQPYIISDSLYQSLISNKVVADPDVYFLYVTYGADSLINHYNLNKLCFFEFNKFNYLGYLLWKNDAVLRMNDMDPIWYVIQNKTN